MLKMMMMMMMVRCCLCLAGFDYGEEFGMGNRDGGHKGKFMQTHNNSDNKADALNKLKKCPAGIHPNDLNLQISLPPPAN